MEPLRQKQAQYPFGEAFSTESECHTTKVTLISAMKMQRKIL
jgi:hypothetical protein